MIIKVYFIFLDQYGSANKSKIELKLFQIYIIINKMKYIYSGKNEKKIKKYHTNNCNLTIKGLISLVLIFFIFLVYILYYFTYILYFRF